MPSYENCFLLNGEAEAGSLHAPMVADFELAEDIKSPVLTTVARSMPQVRPARDPVLCRHEHAVGRRYAPRGHAGDAARTVMLASPSTHYTAFAQAVLLRGAGLDVVWPQLLATVSIRRAVLFGYALLRFRASVAEAR